MNAEKRALETNWWGLTIRGIAAILFGIAAVFWPHLTLTTLVILFSAWVLIDGIVRIVSGLYRKSASLVFDFGNGSRRARRRRVPNSPSINNLCHSNTVDRLHLNNSWGNRSGDSIYHTGNCNF